MEIIRLDLLTALRELLQPDATIEKGNVLVNEKFAPNLLRARKNLSDAILLMKAEGIWRDEWGLLGPMYGTRDEEVSVGERLVAITEGAGTGHEAIGVIALFAKPKDDFEDTQRFDLFELQVHIGDPDQLMVIGKTGNNKMRISDNKFTDMLRAGVNSVIETDLGIASVEGGVVELNIAGSFLGMVLSTTFTD